AICSKAYVKSPKFGTPTGQKAPSDPKESANLGQCEASSKRFTEREYRQQLADLLSNIVCNATADQREIADAVVRNWILNDPNSRDFFSRLAHGLLGSMKDLSQNGVCAGAIRMVPSILTGTCDETGRHAATDKSLAIRRASGAVFVRWPPERVVGSVRAAGRHPRTFAGADIATMQQQIGSSRSAPRPITACCWHVRATPDETPRSPFHMH